LHRGLEEYSRAMDFALDEDFKRHLQKWVARVDRGVAYHALELPDGQVIPGFVQPDALRERLVNLGVPGDLTGKRVLDFGAASGWNSFEMERRGAEVVAVDCVRFEELLVAKRAWGSRVDYRISDMEEVSPESVGRFDISLFLGVLIICGIRCWGWSGFAR